MNYAIKKAPSFVATIYIAGDYTLAKQILQKYCDRGFAVSCTQMDYIYKYGAEAGIAVNIINYPRIPVAFNVLVNHAREIAQDLLEGLSQGSYTIVFPTETEFHSRREND